MNAPTIPRLRDLLRIYGDAHKFPDDVAAFAELTSAVDELADLRQLRTTNDELRLQLADADEKIERCRWPRGRVEEKSIHLLGNRRVSYVVDEARCVLVSEEFVQQFLKLGGEL